MVAMGAFLLARASLDWPRAGPAGGDSAAYVEATRGFAGWMLPATSVKPCETEFGAIGAAPVREELPCIWSMLTTTPDCSSSAVLQIDSNAEGA